MNTLLLRPDNWDLCVDSSGNIALATNPYSLAQDAASAIKTFLGECWYNTTVGVPYFQQVFGKAPPITLLKALFRSAALTVPEVTKARVFISAVGSDRVVRGQVQIKNTAVDF